METTVEVLHLNRVFIRKDYQPVTTAGGAFEGAELLLPKSICRNTYFTRNFEYCILLFLFIFEFVDIVVCFGSIPINQQQIEKN